MPQNNRETWGKRSDVELVQAVISGEEQAFNEIVRRYQKQIQGFVYHIIRDNDQVEDLVQDTFVQAFLQIHRFKQEQSFGRWINIIAKNHAITAYRKRRRRKIANLRMLRTENFQDFGAPPDILVGRMMLRDSITKTLERLESRHSSILILVYLEDKTHAEIAKIFGCPVGTSRWLLSEARKALRKIISPNLR